MVQTFFDIVKAHGGVPVAIGMKVETKEGEGTEFYYSNTDVVLH